MTKMYSTFAKQNNTATAMNCAQYSSSCTSASMANSRLAIIRDIALAVSIFISVIINVAVIIIPNSKTAGRAI